MWEGDCDVLDIFPVDAGETHHVISFVIMMRPVPLSILDPDLHLRFFKVSSTKQGMLNRSTHVDILIGHQILFPSNVEVVSMRYGIITWPGIQMTIKLNNPFPHSSMLIS
jgi:hypothetical protein